MSLNENQQRSVRITLMLLEKSLDEIEHLLRGNGHEGLLYQIHKTIPEGQCQSILKAISLIRVEMKMVKDNFHLEVAHEDMKSKMRGILGIAWENLEDAKSAKLHAYGKVDATLKDTLDPHIDKIIQLIMDNIYPIVL